MAESRVDELFGEGAGAPAPRLGWIYFLLVSGLLLAVLGMLCTSVPGALLVLFAWLIVEQEVDRLESGYLPADTAPTLARARSRTGAGLVTVVLLFFVQATLLCSTSLYEALYVSYATPVLEWIAPPPPPPPPAP